MLVMKINKLLIYLLLKHTKLIQFLNHSYKMMLLLRLFLNIQKNPCQN